MSRNRKNATTVAQQRADLEAKLAALDVAPAPSTPPDDPRRTTADVLEDRARADAFGTPGTFGTPTTEPAFGASAQFPADLAGDPVVRNPTVARALATPDQPVLLDSTIPRVLEPVVDPELAALRAENVELKAQVAGIPTLRAPLPVQSPPFVLTGTDGLPVPNQPPALPVNAPAPVFPSDTSPFDPFASF